MPPAVALVGVPIVRITVSFASTNVSGTIVIVTVPVVAPAAIVIGLAVIEKSVGVAVPVTAYGTVTGRPLAADNWAVTVMVPLSLTLACAAIVHETVGTASSSVIVAV